MPSLTICQITRAMFAYAIFLRKQKIKHVNQDQSVLYNSYQWWHFLRKGWRSIVLRGYVLQQRQFPRCRPTICRNHRHPWQRLVGSSCQFQPTCLGEHFWWSSYGLLLPKERFWPKRWPKVQDHQRQYRQRSNRQWWFHWSRPNR